MTCFVLFPSASGPSLNFNIPKVAYCDLLLKFQITELYKLYTGQPLYYGVNIMLQGNNFSKRAFTIPMLTLVTHDEGGKGGPNMMSFCLKAVLSINVLLSPMAHASCTKRLHTF